MTEQKPRELTVIRGSSFAVPQLIRGAGRKAATRFLEFFAANIRNRNTREAYYRALTDFFAWCDDRGFALIDIEPVVVAAYVEYLGDIYAKPTVKQHLAAIRIAAHESPRTTKLYDRTGDEMTLDEIERIQI